MCSQKPFFLSKGKPLPQPNYSLSPSPSPNGEGSEDCCLQVKESLPKPLQRRGCRLTGCHVRVKERTDEGVCPYFIASPSSSSPNGIIPPSLPEGEECLTGAGLEKAFLIQRRRFFTSKRRPFHCKETPSSNWEGRSFLFALSFFANEALSRYTETIWHRAF